MFLPTSILVFFSNTIFCTIATIKIIRSWEYTFYKPRLLMVLVIIWATYPLGFFEVMTDITKGKGLENKFICSLVGIIKHFGLNRYGFLINLSIFIYLLLVSKWEIRKINRIGNYLNYFLLMVWFVYTFLILAPICGFTRSYPIKGVAGGFKSCSVNSKVSSYTEHIVTYLMAGVSVAASICLSIYFVHGKKMFKIFKNSNSSANRLKNNMRRIRNDGRQEVEELLARRKRSSQLNRMTRKILVSLFLFALINLQSKAMSFFGNSKEKAQDSIWKSIFHDLNLLNPTFYALVYILIDSKNKFDVNRYSFRKIIDIHEVRVMLEKYIKSSGNLSLESSLNEWKKMENLDGKFYKEREIKKLEKEIFMNGIYEFYITDEFVEFYRKYGKTVILSPI